MSLRPLARDVYACLQPDRGLGCSNSGLVRTGGGLVVDTFWDLPHTRKMIDLYADVRGAVVHQVVNTHHNGDHCWGNQLFPDAEIIGHRDCAAHFGTERPETMQMLRNAGSSGVPMLETMARRLAAWDFAGIELRPPTRLVDETLGLDVGGVEVRVIHVGPAHTAGDLLVHLPAERIVFAGDVLFRLCTPIGWEGTFARWIAALDTIVALEPAIVVPGHGPLCGVEGPAEMKAYLQYVRAESRRGFDRGLTELDAAKGIDLGPYAGWTEPERLLFNVARAYREFRGEPFDAAIDVNAMFGGMHELAQAQAARAATTSDGVAR